MAEESGSRTRVSFPVDYFAFGVVAACLLTGRCPWMREASRDGQAAGSAAQTALAALAMVLGPVTEESWPGHVDLPGWDAFARQHGGGMQAARACETPPAARLAALNERRPLRPDDPGVAVVQRYLRWGPGLRATAAAFCESAGDVQGDVETAAPPASGCAAARPGRGVAAAAAVVPPAPAPLRRRCSPPSSAALAAAPPPGSPPRQGQPSPASAADPTVHSLLLFLLVLPPLLPPPPPSPYLPPPPPLPPSLLLIDNFSLSHHQAWFSGGPGVSLEASSQFMILKLRISNSFKDRGRSVFKIGLSP